MIYLLLGAGIWFTLRSGFIQFRYIRKFGRSLKNSLAAAGRINVVSGALYQPCGTRRQRQSGGRCAGHQRRRARRGLLDVGTALLGMATSFAECSLAQLYKEKDKNGQFRGGPAWYMARGWDALDGRAVFAFFTARLRPYF
jgi:AGCS family alanine or glycine:cation symporter